MFSCCCCGDDAEEDERTLKAQLCDTEPFARLRMTRNMRRLVGGVANVLKVVLPEMPRLFPSQSEDMEQEGLRQLIVVMLGVVERQDTSLSLDERLECLRRAGPRINENSTDAEEATAELYFAALVKYKETAGPTAQSPLLKVDMLQRTRSFAAHNRASPTGSSPASSPREQEMPVAPAPSAPSSPSSAAAQPPSTHPNHLADLPQLLTMWYQADKDCSGSITEAELKRLFERLNISISSKRTKALIKEVDANTNYLIEFKEFMHMYENITTIEEVSAIFKRYSTTTKTKSMFSNAVRRVASKMLSARSFRRAGGATGAMRRAPASASGASTPQSDALNASPSAFASIPMLQSSHNLSGDPHTEARFGNTNRAPDPRDVHAAMSVGDLVRFLHEEQCEHDIDLPAYSDELAQMLLPFGITDPDDSSCAISRRQFQQGLLDSSNSWIHPRESRIHHDMTQPLTHYFIDSSHNTYISGHQLTGRSHTDMYAKALLSGCRCVELDCYDGPDNDPIVTHGGTLTTKIRFFDVITTIDQCAFRTSPYPVTLSLEVHTSKRQQVEMVNIMRKVFGPKLTSSALAEASSLFGFEFSPEGLKYKILVKCKRIAGSGATREEGDFLAVDADESANVKTASTAAISQELSDATFMASVKYKSLEHLFTLPHYGVTSIDESKVLSWLKPEKRGLATDAAKGFMLRVYPAGARMDSTNMDPQNSWNIGAQMSAMNIQTLDTGMRLNQARFRLNGRCGYLLKPLCMRQAGAPAAFKDNLTLTVTVVCGVNLPRPNRRSRGDILDPFVQVWIRGFHGDDTSASPQVTAIIQDNGFNPAWKQSFTFPIQAIELGTLCLRVLDKDVVSNSVVAENAAPLAALREGYRQVSLFDNEGKQLSYPTCLLVHISWNHKDPRAALTTAVGGKAPPGRIRNGSSFDSGPSANAQGQKQQPQQQQRQPQQQQQQQQGKGEGTRSMMGAASPPVSPVKAKQQAARKKGMLSDSDDSAESLVLAANASKSLDMF